MTLPGNSISFVRDRSCNPWRSQEIHHCWQSSFDSLGLTFPNCQRSPPGRFKLQNLTSVTLDVASELVLPKIDARLWSGGKTAGRMPMPKASMDKQRLAACDKHDVGRPRQTLHVRLKTVAEGVQCTSDHHFRLGSLLTNRAHDTRSSWIDGRVQRHDPGGSGGTKSSMDWKTSQRRSAFLWASR